MKTTNFAVTLSDLRKAGACFDGYNKVVRMLQGKQFSKEDEERERYILFAHDGDIPLVDIVKNNDINDALWALCCVKDCDRDARLFAVWAARQVEHMIEDARCKEALNVAERFANGAATQEELEAAREAAWEAAENAAGNAAWAAAGDTAWAAANCAALDAAWAAAGEAALDAAWASQVAMFIKMCEGTAPWQSTSRHANDNQPEAQQTSS